MKMGVTWARSYELSSILSADLLTTLKFVNEPLRHPKTHTLLYVVHLQQVPIVNRNPNAKSLPSFH